MDNGLSDLLSVVTYPIKKLVNLLFSLTIGRTNIGSLVITGMVIAVLITAIMHGGNVVHGIARIRDRIESRRERRNNS